MCGRYLIDDDTYSEILLTLNTPGAVQTFAGGEIFPANIAPVYTHDGTITAKWGFPHWKNPGVIINARAETALDKKMFSAPLLQRRCAVPATGFYEWTRIGGAKKKDKYLLRLPEKRTLFMAGIMNSFRDSAGMEYTAFVILTTSANESVAQIHDRMPVIIAPDEHDLWISNTEYIGHVLHRRGPELFTEIA